RRLACLRKPKAPRAPTAGGSSTDEMAWAARSLAIRQNSPGEEVRIPLRALQRSLRRRKRERPPGNQRPSPYGAPRRRRHAPKPRGVQKPPSRPRRRRPAWRRRREIHSRTPYPSANPTVSAVMRSSIRVRTVTALETITKFYLPYITGKCKRPFQSMGGSNPAGFDSAFGGSDGGAGKIYVRVPAAAVRRSASERATSGVIRT